MREDTVTTKVYEFDELSDEAKAVAVVNLASINIHDEWWESTYEDAATIGLKIEEFELDRGAYVRGKLTEDAEAAAALIQEHHGEACETHKDAMEFLNAVSVTGSIFEDQDDYDPDYEEFTESDQYAELCQKFKKTICEDYRIMLQREYEYRCSEEQIIEAIKANEYEFTAEGEVY